MEYAAPLVAVCKMSQRDDGNFPATKWRVAMDDEFLCWKARWNWPDVSGVAFGLWPNPVEPQARRYIILQCARHAVSG